MARCSYCKLEMTDQVACTMKIYDDMVGKPPLARIPYGTEPNLLAWVERGEIPALPDNCRDCGTPLNGLHHPGCDVERCPGCGGQAIGCDCTEPEYEEEA